MAKQNFESAPMTDSDNSLVSPVAPRFLPNTLIAECQTFRDACVLAWEHRAHPALTKQLLAVLANLYAPHVTDHFHPSATDAKGNGRRALPADKIAEVEHVLGNRAMSQYLARRAGLTIMEEVIASKEQ